MKHHIAVKFIAVVLATISLFTLIASGIGIISLTAADLYKRSVDELYEENMFSTRQNLAVHLVHQYATVKLGQLPESYFYERWGSSWMYDNFQYGYYSYSIFDENGRLVESTVDSATEDATVYIHVVTDLSFRRVQSLLNAQNTAHPQIPAATAPPAPDTTEVTAPEESIPEDQATIPASVQEYSLTAEATSKKEIFEDSYYDPELGKWVDFTYFIDELPPYTVELHLLPGAVVVEPIWDLLTVVWQLRYALFYVLGGSILLFAICSVYLCCAAGKKPGQTEIRAAGLNCVPLDLYFLLGGGSIVLILSAGMPAVEYLLRRSPDVLVPFAVLAGLVICLIFVGFCFACAAQFKTPGGYWWRNSVIGRILRLLHRLGKGIVILFRKFSPWLEKTMGRFFLFLGKAVIFLWTQLCAAVVAIYNLTEKVLTKLFRLLIRFFRWLFRKFDRFLSMLPLTWQWLIIGFSMLMLMALVFATNGEEILSMICLGICIGIILYGSHAFGILLENTKRMAKGDLEAKISDQFLLGSFREFAGDLNALADVAVIAAQKQLKSERMKTELITNVSHDIKTPLTSIINYVDLLGKPHSEEEGEEYLDVLNRQSQRLKKLVDDLMEMSKASTGNLAVDIVSVNAGEAINQSLGEFADKLERSQLIPVFRQPEEPIYMKADGRLVWRVMSNLLSNAVKYALPGTRLYIDLEQQDGKVIISMKNISRESLNVSADELLERFVRGDTSRNTEGSGLGLNIARSLMELQKGQLQLLVDGDLFKVTLVFPGVQM